MLLPMFEDGHLVVNECLRFILNDFKDAGVFFVEDKDVSLSQALLGIKLAGCALLYSDAEVWFVRLIDGINRRAFVYLQAKSFAQIGIGTINGLCTLGGFGH